MRWKNSDQVETGATPVLGRPMRSDGGILHTSDGFSMKDRLRTCSRRRFIRTNSAVLGGLALGTYFSPAWAKVGAKLSAPSAADLPMGNAPTRSEEHTSELQSRLHLVCRLL